MADLTIQTTKPTRRINTSLMAAAGAVAGAGARYVLPTRKELSSIFAKENVDSFVSSSAAVARANGRSILKYAGVGALVASGIALIAKAIKGENKKDITENIQYSKYGAAIDSSDYACMVMWYDD